LLAVRNHVAPISFTLVCSQIRPFSKTVANWEAKRNIEARHRGLALELQIGRPQYVIADILNRMTWVLTRDHDLAAI
jgi:hypothetical protein